MTKREILIAQAIFYKGDWWEIVNSISRKEYVPYEMAEKLVSNLNCKTLTILDEEYPSEWKRYYMPPLVLFYHGDISLILNDKNNLAVIGTRDPSDFGVKTTQELVSRLAKKYVIVSGLARGVDGLSHQAAIENSGHTVAVLGSGINKCYPISNKDIYSEIKERHLVISEYPGECEAKPSNFPLRNRLIALFSKGILVTEASLKSGTSITVKYGLFYGRDIMCVPSINLGNSGCNEFIRTGAYLVENAEQVEDIMD